MPEDPVVTVLMPTRNRVHAVPETVVALVEACRATAITTEILVVDNGSSDSTPAVLDELSTRYPEVRVVRDDIPGKSGACNRGLLLARGRVILFTDDDVRVPLSWVSDMAQPILEGKADAVAGRLVLASYLDRPWLTPGIRVRLAELLDVTGGLPGMVGATMAASKDAALSVGFDEELGPGARGFADDVLFNLRLKDAGYRLVGSAGPPAVHHLDADRLEYKRMVDLAYRNGSSTAYLWHHWLHSDLKFVRLRGYRNAVRLGIYRALHRRQSDGIDKGEGIDEREFDLIEGKSFCHHLLAERKRPQNYPRPSKGSADNLVRLP
jgi:glycosyltransferase involved in cell wall biosynthesis